MTGIEVILAALAAGAAAGSTDVAKYVVSDSYTGLRDMLRRRLSGRQRAQEALDAVETAPDTWQVGLADELTDSGADRDENILAAARRLLELADPDGIQAGKSFVDVPQSQNTQVGNHTVRVDTSYGPTAGAMGGPVTVTYGEVPIPPTKPGA